ncbi:hypothetical protein Trco_006803 [Trichoderma cornu-damae]|uniref:Uncharacterized protein n=1 Tax=Trichoderma cornu-damae TaxID=654480 RepID=A0A9P8QFN8_9HYPO|nr:hypothetical protein Trco_006803 [Trichoderma cornu-damae]
MALDMDLDQLLTATDESAAGASDEPAIPESDAVPAGWHAVVTSSSPEEGQNNYGAQRNSLCAVDRIQPFCSKGYNM